jgi:hypothetical protein
MCVMATIDCESRLGPDITLHEGDDILDQIAALSLFSSINLQKRVEQAFSPSARTKRLALRSILETA